MKPIVLASIFSAMALPGLAQDNSAAKLLTMDVVGILEDAGLPIESADQISREIPCEAVNFDIKIIDSVDIYYGRGLGEAIYLASLEAEASILLGHDDGGDVVQAMVIKDGSYISVEQPNTQDIFSHEDPRFKNIMPSDVFELQETSSEFMPLANAEFTIVDAKQQKLCPN